jgi:hypothetical protein
MEAKRFETPVALFVFNRPDTTRRVFEAIANVRPARLLLVADGPRPGKGGEAEACQQVREIVSRVDWPSEVSTNFAESNLGCKDRMISGLNWVFSLVEEAIILEDDILPDPSFFSFCEAMLSRYRNDSRISMVAGFNIVQDSVRTDSSYFFSHLTHIWGWATWRQSWARYDEKLTNWPAIRDAGLLWEIFERAENVKYWTNVFDQMHQGTGPNTWDYQWMYTNLTNHSLSIVPRVNLVENIGFGHKATHTIDESAKPAVSVHSIELPLTHPPAVVPLRSMDRIDQRLSGFQTPGLAKRILGRLRRVLSKFSHRPSSRHNPTP